MGDVLSVLWGFRRRVSGGIGASAQNIGAGEGLRGHSSSCLSRQSVDRSEINVDGATACCCGPKTAAGNVDLQAL